MAIQKVFLDSAHIECRPNLVSLSRIYFYLKKNGHLIVDDPRDAAYIIVNSCGFTQRLAQHTHKMLNVYNKNITARVISIGCLNKIDIDLVKTCQDVRIITDSNDLDDIFYCTIKFRDVPESYIEETMDIKKNADHPSFRILNFFFRPFLKTSHLYNIIRKHVYRDDKIFVEIGSGCVGNCRYCIIKKAKGKPVSRKPEDILNDIAKIYSPGKQLDLVADDCGCYGIDLGTSLPELLLTINDKHPDISMDITYLSPWWLTKQKEEYIRIFKELNINSINISMQSGSDKVLAGMNRNYTVQEILGIIEKLKSISPQTGFWTHIMVGFPGEVWSDFWKTLVMATHFYAVHAFAYSPRRGTESAALKNNNGKFTITLRYGIALIFAKTNSFLKIVKEIIKKNPLNISSEY